MERGQLSTTEADLAATVPVAKDVTVEADSGGHTDNRPLAVLLPAIIALRDDLSARFGYREAPRVGAAGGLGSPAARGGRVRARRRLRAHRLGQPDGGGSRGLRRRQGHAGAGRHRRRGHGARRRHVRDGREGAGAASGNAVRVPGGRLYDAYRAHPSLEAIPAGTRDRLEREVLGASIDDVWAWTREFWRQRDPHELDRAAADPKHRMALVFRWYLGMSSRWAIEGRTERRTDYQLWGGPAIGAFNRWVAGSFLADTGGRGVVQIARNLLEGAAVVTRAHQLRTFGVPVPPQAFTFSPRPLV